MWWSLRWEFNVLCRGVSFDRMGGVGGFETVVGGGNLGTDFEAKTEIMSKYELVLVFSPKAGPGVEKVLELLSKSITESGGRIVKREDWGKKTLAYPINKFTEGEYIYAAIEIPEEAVSKVDRKIKVEESVIRYLLVRKDG